MKRRRNGLRRGFARRVRNRYRRLLGIRFRYR